MASRTISTLPFLLVSIQILTKNRSLELLMAPVKALLTVTMVPSEPLIDREMTEHVLELIRPSVPFLKAFFQIQSPVIAFLTAFSSFRMQSNGRFFSWTLIPELFWSIHLTMVGLHCAWSLGASILTLIVIGKIAELSISKLNSKIDARNRSPIEEVVLSKDDLWAHVTDHVHLVTRIRKWDQSLKPILGVTMVFYYANCTFLTYVSISPVASNLFSISCVSFLPFMFVMFVLNILIPATIRERVQEHSAKLHQISFNCELNHEETLKLNYVLNGTRFNSTLDPIAFLPPHHYSLFLWVC